MARYYPDRAADLILQNDFDESLLGDESCSDSTLTLKMLIFPKTA